jgi:hypothetical protein
LPLPFIEPLPQEEESDPPTTEEAIKQLEIVAKKIQHLVSADIAKFSLEKPPE